jgi:hypothetical protein
MDLVDRFRRLAEWQIAVAAREEMEHTPEQVARYTVEHNGGEYGTTVVDLLELFGRETSPVGLGGRYGKRCLARAVTPSPTFGRWIGPTPFACFWQTSHRPDLRNFRSKMFAKSENPG